MMTIDPRLVTVHESVQVDCPVEEAFGLFTTRMGEWWPLDQASYGGGRAKDIFLEPRVGGRFFERFVDGDELQVGSVVVCEPPWRIVFTWTTADWEGETEVEVTFTTQEVGTRVDLSHRGFDRLGPLGPDVAAKFRGGWPGVMHAFKQRGLWQSRGVRPSPSDSSKAGYELEFEDTFDGEELDESRWFPYYLPQWSSRTASAARYQIGGGQLRLIIEADQQPWCPEFDGGIRVSSLQTGVFSGPVGSYVGQQRFNPDLLVRETQRNARLYTPQYGLFELRAKAIDDPRCMVALWMIGYEDEPDRSAEICICEIFGRDLKPDRAAVGMGVHPFGDPSIVDEFAAEVVAIDAREYHVYAAEWTPEYVAFFVDHRLIKTVEQSPQYPMQFMLGIYEFPDDAPPLAPAHPYPKQFTIDYFRGYRPLSRQPAHARTAGT
jgi:uncharacterized protein YndB with AHSA1/START domain